MTNLRHRCAGHECRATVADPQKLFCTRCWRKLTKSAQFRLYRAWNEGRTTADYADARAAAIAETKPAHVLELPLEGGRR